MNTEYREDAARKRIWPTMTGAKGAGSPFEVLLIYLKLGLSCFGGPIAHIGYFRDEFVVRRRWLDESAYADLVALWSDVRLLACWIHGVEVESAGADPHHL